MDGLLYLEHGAGDEVLLEEGSGRHVVHDGGGQVGQDRVHRVPGLLPSHPEVPAS